LALTRAGHEIFGWGYHACPGGVIRGARRVDLAVMLRLSKDHAQRGVGPFTLP